VISFDLASGTTCPQLIWLAGARRLDGNHRRQIRRHRDAAAPLNHAPILAKAHPKIVPAAYRNQICGFGRGRKATAPLNDRAVLQDERPAAVAALDGGAQLEDPAPHPLVAKAFEAGLGNELPQPFFDRFQLALPLLQLMPLPDWMLDVGSARHELALQLSVLSLSLPGTISLDPLATEAALWQLLPALVLFVAVLTRSRRVQRGRQMQIDAVASLAGGWLESRNTEIDVHRAARLVGHSVVGLAESGARALPSEPESRTPENLGPMPGRPAVRRPAAPR